MKFELDEQQLKTLSEWQVQCAVKLIEKQRLEMEPEEFESKTFNGEHPYTGAIGGAYKYSFSPTGLGCCVEVEHVMLGEKINLTDYSSW